MKIRPDCGKVQATYVGQLSLSHTNHTLLGSKLAKSACLLEDPVYQTTVQGQGQRLYSVTREAMNLRALMVVFVLALSSSEAVPLSGCDGANDCADASDLLQIHGGESPIDGQLNRMMHFAEVAEFAQDQNRSLLSQRFSLEPAETGSCKQCACEFIEKADKCGKKLGKSLKHCGSVEKCTKKTVKSMTKCAKYLAQGIVTAKWNGKHCKIKTCYKEAKECMVPQSCFEAVPLADCWIKLGSEGGKAADQAVQALKSLGDIKAKQMENAVMSGLDYSWHLLQKAWGFTLPGMVKDLFEKDGLWGSMKHFIDGAWDFVKSIGDDMADFFQAIAAALKKAVKGPISLPRTANGKYVVLPYSFVAPWFTDCDFFQQWGHLSKALAKIYNPSLWDDIGKAYKGMGKALLKCGMLTTDIPVTKGITLKQPTPFITMQKVSMTLSKKATDVAEGFLNLMYHAAHEVEDVVKMAKKGIDKLSDYVSNLVFKNLHLLQDNDGNSLLQLATGVSPEQLGKGGLAALQTAGACPGYNSTQNHVNTQNYAWMIRVQGSVGAELTDLFKVKAAHGIGVYLGCRCGKFRAVPFINSRWVSLDAGFPPKEAF